MKDNENKHKTLSIIAVASFLVSLSFCVFLISVTIINRINIEKLRLEQQAYERTLKINDTITKLLYKTEIIAALIINDNGSMDSFERIAPAIVDDPAIQNIILAPDGIVKKVYPYTENENLLGWNYFDERAGNREAIAAQDSGELVLGGPIDIIQSGKAIFGIMPVFIDTLEEADKFWGFVSVTLKFPQILDRAELGIFDTYGVAYELWRINPDTDKKQILATNFDNITPKTKFIEKPVQILNAIWYLKVSYADTWYRQPYNIALVFAGFFISFIVFFVMQNNYKLKNMQYVFELMAITDPLTGIFNRRHFMETVRISIEKARRNNEKCFFTMFDIDKFKNVNDTYGHQIGDKVLVDIATRIKTNIRPYDLFARYGGEEFLIFTCGITEKEVCDMTERLRVRICGKKYEYGNISFDCSASFGIACMEDYDLDKAIKQSDEALYAAKRNGRNCVVYYSENIG
ncbi:MAG: sensor domain-containing diguanylate cyclase [Treponema sp.]|jgi:diguanylate cyclase (GGDEF)-like protein|nr:sensor domain-containing diguanylate cyclase [Treponema sp.]